MSSATTTVTTNLTNSLLMTTKSRTRSVSIIVAAAADLGGGTLTLNTRPAGSGATPETIDTLVAGGQFEYQVGPSMDVFLNMAGATAPNVVVSWSEIHS